MLKSYLTWPWILSVPLLLAGFVCSIFFIGTDSILIGPAILCFMAFGGLAIYPNFREGWAIPQTNTFFFVMMFWLWLVLSLMWTTTPYVSTLFTMIIGILPGVFALSILAQKREEWVTVHALAMWLTIGGFAVWALLQFFVPALYAKFGPRIHHPLLDPNSLAGLLNLAVCPALGLFFFARERLWTVVTGAVVLVFYTALVVTQSRAGYACCAGAVMVLLPFAVIRNPRGFPWQRLLYLAAIVVAVPYILNHMHGSHSLDNLVGESMAESFTQKRSMEDRFYLWESTWHMIKDHFFFGTGLASFYFYYPRYRQVMDRSDGFFAHMDPLQYWAEIGVMAPILFYGVLICVLLRTIKAVRSLPRENFAGRLMVVAPFCGMLAVTAHSHLNYHLYMPGLLLPLSVLMAFWYVATEKAIGDAGTRLIWKPEGKVRFAAIAIIAGIALLSGGWLVRVCGATYLIGQVQQAAAKGDSDEASRKLYLAGLVSPGSYSRYPEYEARIRVGKLFNGGAKKMDKQEVRKIYEDAIRYLDEAEKLNPAFTTIWDLRARLNYAVNGILINDGLDLAIRDFQRVIDANPLSAETRVALAQIYRSRGELQKAAAVLESGVQWPRQKGVVDLNFLLTLSSIKAQMGDQYAAEQYFKEAQNRAKSYGIVIQQAPPSQSQ